METEATTILEGEGGTETNTLVRGGGWTVATTCTLVKWGGVTLDTTVEGRERVAEPTTLVEETVVITLVERGVEAKTLEEGGGGTVTITLVGGDWS